MKKMISIILLACMLLPVCAFADVLSDGWKDATDDELEAAISTISEELSARRNAALSENDVVTLSGSGTAIENISIPFSPSRVTLACSESATGKITGGSRDLDINAYRTGYDQEVYDEIGAFSFLIETEGDWTLTAEPLPSMAGLTEISGNDSMISDYFVLKEPIIAHITTGTASDLNSFMVQLVYCNSDGQWNTRSLGVPFISKGESLDYDFIIQPLKGIELYAIRVYSNLILDWTITAK